MNSSGKGVSSGLTEVSRLAGFLRWCLQNRVRGSSWLTNFLSYRVDELQHVPLDIPGWAPVYVDLRIPNAHLMLVESPYSGLWRELDEVEIMSRFVGAGDIVFDIGANFGLHSIVLSRLVGSSGRVCAFEPNSELLPVLKHTIGQLGNATLHGFALSDKEAESVLFVPADDSTASLADWTVESPVFSQDGPSHTVRCREYRIDDLIEAGTLPNPDFIKCDVEGAELLVFQGAQRTLNQINAPIILFEANECASRAFNLTDSAAKDFLTALDEPSYRFFEVQKGGTLTKLNKISSGLINILAVPESKLVGSESRDCVFSELVPGLHVNAGSDLSRLQAGTF